MNSIFPLPFTLSRVEWKNNIHEAYYVPRGREISCGLSFCNLFHSFISRAKELSCRMLRFYSHLVLFKMFLVKQKCHTSRSFVLSLVACNWQQTFTFSETSGGIFSFTNWSCNHLPSIFCSFSSLLIRNHWVSRDSTPHVERLGSNLTVQWF